MDSKQIILLKVLNAKRQLEILETFRIMEADSAANSSNESRDRIDSIIGLELDALNPNENYSANNPLVEIDKKYQTLLIYTKQLAKKYDQINDINLKIETELESFPSTSTSRDIRVNAIPNLKTYEDLRKVLIKYGRQIIEELKLEEILDIPNTSSDKKDFNAHFKLSSKTKLAIVEKYQLESNFISKVITKQFISFDFRGKALNSFHFEERLIPIREGIESTLGAKLVKELKSVKTLDENLSSRISHKTIEILKDNLELRLLYFLLEKRNIDGKRFSISEFTDAPLQRKAIELGKKY